MKYKLITLVAILFSAFCISRLALAVCSSNTSLSVTSKVYTDVDGKTKYFKTVDVSLFRICNDDSDWHADATITEGKSVLIGLVNNQVTPTNPFDVYKPPIIVKNGTGDDNHIIDCPKNDGGIPCNDPNIRLVIKIVKNVQSQYVATDIGLDGGDQIQNLSETFFYGFKKFGDALEIIRLIPAAKDPLIKYTFTSYTNIETDLICKFEETEAANAVDSINPSNPTKLTVKIIKNDPSLSVVCWFPLPTDEKISLATKFTLYWNTFETGNYFSFDWKEKTMYATNPYSDSIQESEFSNNVPFSILKSLLPNKPIIFSSIWPTATTNPGGYTVTLYLNKALIYSTVIKFNKAGIMCPDETTEKDANGDCFDGCPEATPKWDSTAKPKECVADCTQSNSVTVDTGYVLNKDKDACECKNTTNFPKLDTKNKWCGPTCTGGTVVVKDGKPTCICEDKWKLSDDGDTCKYEKPPDCSDDADCGAHYECEENDCKLIEGETCEGDSECINGETCIDGSCGYKTLDDNCSVDSECGTGLECIKWHCKKPDCSSIADCSTGQICQSNVCTTAPTTNLCQGPGQTKNSNTGHCSCTPGWACTPDTYGDCTCTQYDSGGCKTGETKDSSGDCICDKGYILDDASGQCVYVSLGKDRVPQGCAITGPLASSNGPIALMIPLATLVAIRLRRKFLS